MIATGLIGGGRWARVIASVLQRIGPGPVLVTSVGNPSAWRECPQDWVAVEMSEMLRDPAVRRVIIARRASQHADTVIAALRAGKDVLVEKPFCLTRHEAEAIIDAARGRICQTGLVLLFAANQQRFRSACLDCGQITRVRIDWADPHNEIRGGVMKEHDRSLNPVQDVLPHIWSLVRPLVTGPIEFLDAALLDGGEGVILRFGRNTLIECKIARGQASRARRLEVAGPRLEAVLDFASEPGFASLNGRSIDVAKGHASPLEAELRAFLSGIRTPLSDVAQAVESLDLTLIVMARIRQLQRTVLIQGCSTPSAAAIGVLNEIALGGIAACGRPASRQEIARWLEIDPSHAGFSSLWTAACAKA